ncbi:hypothetical protein E4U03_09270 [Rothia nasimurium]|uniref:Uncharacterized protein n=1 Tax=Rothia nasimurium TaxID=85336 RepID=A0A4Y9F3E7_9MICC|nr:hypothetical protein [Rothia nasimurium]MBF0808787.1 hypothetical protein [Rothia nasimurium]TFU21352.1 hypothetical protein E4U03_09270 [Rothia nasimurium]
MLHARFKARPLLTCIALVLCIAVASLLSNITTEAQLSGQSEVIAYVRKVVSTFLNSGTLWAALGFYAGWLWSGSRTRPVPLWVPVTVAVAASLGALAGHYALGNLLGIMEASIWIENYHWFIAAVIISGPLGWLGARSAQDDRAGKLLRYLIPVGAVAEPLVTGMFWYPSEFSFPVSEIASSYTVGLLLMLLGVLGLWVVYRANKAAAPALENPRRSF